MCVLKSRGSSPGFVAAQKESKDVTDKNLLAMSGVGKSLYQVEGAFHCSIYLWNATIDNPASYIDWFS